MSENQEPATSAAEEGTTPSETPSHPLSTAGSVTSGEGKVEGAEGRAEEKEEKSDAPTEFDDVPKELRPHVEKLAKKWYTKKTMDLASEAKTKEALWTTEKQRYESQLEEVKRVVEDIKANPHKLPAYLEAFGVSQTPQEIPPEITTVGDLLDWNKKQMDSYKKQMESYKESLRQELRREAQTTVQQTTAVQRWDQALSSKREDKHFAKYERFITDIAQNDPEVRAKFNGSNESEVLAAAQSKFRDMMREDMEEVRSSLLSEQKKKSKASTQVPIKTTQPLPRSAQTREEVIARVRERLGPALD